MSITQSVKHIAARCNNCGASITGEINYFQLAFQKKELLCRRCRGAKLIFDCEDGENVSISVPCPACGQVHSFKRTLRNFFSCKDDLFRFVCPMAPVDIFFLGKKEKTLPALAESKRELERLINEFQYEQGENIGDGYELEIREKERQMRQMIENFVYECANYNSIVCSCKDYKVTDRIELEKLRDGVKLTCKHCGKSVTLSPGNSELLEEFIRSGKIIIDG